LFVMSFLDASAPRTIHFGSTPVHITPTTRLSPSLPPSVNGISSCPGGAAPPLCLNLPPPGQTTRPLLPSQMTQPWNH
jgi:hypothetical protein